MKTVIVLGFLTVSFLAVADEVTKREFVKDDVVYIEETTKTAKQIAKKTYPKPGQEKNTITSIIHGDGSVTTTSHSQIQGAVSTVSYTTPQKENESTIKDGGLFLSSLKNCQPFQRALNETMKLQIHGMVDGKCKFTQTLPKNGIQTCHFTEQQRKDFNPGTDALEKSMLDKSICRITGY